MKRYDIVELAKAFADSFEGLELDDMTILAHDILGLNCYRNHLHEDELDTYISKALERIASLNIKQDSLSWSMITLRIKKIMSDSPKHRVFTVSKFRKVNI
jgi:hypothetical protein